MKEEISNLKKEKELLEAEKIKAEEEKRVAQDEAAKLSAQAQKSGEEAEAMKKTQTEESIKAKAQGEKLSRAEKENKALKEKLEAAMKAQAETAEKLKTMETEEQGGFKTRLLDVEKDVKGLTKVFLHGMADEPASPSPVREMQSEQSARDVVASLELTMDNMCHTLGYEVKEEEQPEIPPPSPLPEGTGMSVKDFSVDPIKLVGLKKLRAMRQSSDFSDAGSDSPPHPRNPVQTAAMLRYDTNQDGGLDSEELGHLLNDVVSGTWDPTQQPKLANVGTLNALDKLSSLYSAYDTF